MSCLFPRKLLETVSSLCSSTGDQPTGDDRSTGDDQSTGDKSAGDHQSTGDQHNDVTGGQGVMVPPASVVADRGNDGLEIEPVLEILFPNHVIRYTKEKINEAIMNEQPIGQGTTSIVYRGVIDGRETAVKCILPKFAKQFEEELKIVSMCDHPRIVKFIGYCFQGEHRYIVYQFMRGGNLKALISREGQYAQQPPLPWEKRLDMGLAVLEGIEYLQNNIEGDLGIAHVDLKPENILLDEDRNPYIADFGAAVTFEKGNVNAYTKDNSCWGTVGYTDPAITNFASVSSGTDIFSFGTIMLELMMGLELDIGKRLELDPRKIAENITPDYVRRHIMDPTLADQVSLEQVMEVVILASHCRAYDRETRPEIEEVTQRLMAIRNGN